MIRIVPFKLGRWFPPNDPIATIVAILCVLREDFLLELQGIVADSLGQLDGNGSVYRRTYFWRNSLRTLEEIRRALNRVNSYPEFRGALALEPNDVQTAFEELKRALNRASGQFLSGLRSTLTAHLDEPTIQAALDALDLQHEALMEAAEELGKQHYRFAHDVLWAALLRDIPSRDHVAKANEILGRSADLMSAVKAIDDVFTCYIRARGLHLR